MLNEQLAALEKRLQELESLSTRKSIPILHVPSYKPDLSVSKPIVIYRDRLKIWQHSALTVWLPLEHCLAIFLVILVPLCLPVILHQRLHHRVVLLSSLMNQSLLMHLIQMQRMGIP